MPIAPRLHRPDSIEQLQEVVAGAERVKSLGSRHCFNDIADTPGDLVDMSGLPDDVVIDGNAVTVSAGMKYGTLASVLQENSLALANLASLPHTSIAGATETGIMAHQPRHGLRSPFAALLIGQPTLRHRLRLGVLAALDQRISVRYALAGMTPEDTAGYLNHHLKIAGRADTLFSTDADHRHPQRRPRLPPRRQQPRDQRTHRSVRPEKRDRRRESRPHRRHRKRRRLTNTITEPTTPAQRRQRPRPRPSGGAISHPDHRHHQRRHHRQDQRRSTPESHGQSESAQHQSNSPASERSAP